MREYMTQVITAPDAATDYRGTVFPGNIIGHQSGRAFVVKGVERHEVEIQEVALPRCHAIAKASITA